MLSEKKTQTKEYIWFHLYDIIKCATNPWWKCTWKWEWKWGEGWERGYKETWGNFGVMYMFIILMVMMASQVYTGAKSYKIVHFK